MKKGGVNVLRLKLKKFNYNCFKAIFKLISKKVKIIIRKKSVEKEK